MGALPRIVTLACLVAVASATTANASAFYGTSDPHGVSILLDTNKAGKPTGMSFGHYTVPCTNGYRLGYRVGSMDPPFDRATPRVLVDRWHKVKQDGSEITISVHAHERDDGWQGRFKSRWVFRDDGEVSTRCGFAFSLLLEPAS